MGISTIQSYRGAQIFEAVGLGPRLVERYFTGTASRIGGIELRDIADEALARHERGFPRRRGPTAPSSTPAASTTSAAAASTTSGTRTTIAPLQQARARRRHADATRSSPRPSTTQTRASAARCAACWSSVPAATPVPLDEVEPAERDRASASPPARCRFGSISPEAHETLAIAMNRIGGRSQHRRGRRGPGALVPRPERRLRRAIKQVASARFGVTTDYLVNADELQIKMAQGAKPGEGGQLPGHKVDDAIARAAPRDAGRRR